MKGISAVIATILMLMITIALAGTAYLYITGVFTSRTGVVLSIDSSTKCNPAQGIGRGNISVVVKNDGTTVAGTVNIDITFPNGTYDPGISPYCSMAGINAGSTNTTICIKDATGTALMGTYGIRVSSGSSSATGSVYCSG